MATVIDRIEFNSRWTHRYPELARYGDGLMVILDPEQIDSDPDLAGRTVNIERPDGTRDCLQAHQSEAHHGTVGLFFKDIDESVVPRLSILTWDAT